jgi:hypothetical protein
LKPAIPAESLLAPHLELVCVQIPDSLDIKTLDGLALSTKGNAGHADLAHFTAGEEEYMVTEASVDAAQSVLSLMPSREGYVVAKPFSRCLQIRRKVDTSNPNPAKTNGGVVTGTNSTKAAEDNKVLKQVYKYVLPGSEQAPPAVNELTELEGNASKAVLYGSGKTNGHAKNGASSSSSSGVKKSKSGSTSERKDKSKDKEEREKSEKKDKKRRRESEGGAAGGDAEERKAKKKKTS